MKTSTEVKDPAKRHKQLHSESNTKIKNKWKYRQSLDVEMIRFLIISDTKNRLLERLKNLM